MPSHPLLDAGPVDALEPFCRRPKAWLKAVAAASRRDSSTSFARR